MLNICDIVYILKTISFMSLLHTHTHTHTHTYMCVCVCKCLRIFWQHFFINTYLIEYNRHFLSTYFFNPFDMPYRSHDIRLELFDKSSMISYFEKNIFVGLTPTTLSRRHTMHFSDTSSIAQHLKKHSCPTTKLRKILTENTTILEHQNNKQKVQILEALHIRNI